MKPDALRGIYQTKVSAIPSYRAESGRLTPLASVLLAKARGPKPISKCNGRCRVRRACSFWP